MFDNDVLLLMSFKHRCDLSDSSPGSLYSLVCDVPHIAPVIASAALY